MGEMCCRSDTGVQIGGGTVLRIGFDLMTCAMMFADGIVIYSESGSRSI